MCNLCGNTKFCKECPRQGDPHPYQTKVVSKSLKPFSEPPCFLEKDIPQTKEKIIPWIDGTILHMGERVFHIISNKRKCWNTIKICTKEGILFYFREVKKNDETSLSYIKQEPAFPKKPRKQQRYEGEELQIIPSLVGLSPSIFMEDLNW